MLLKKIKKTDVAQKPESRGNDWFAGIKQNKQIFTGYEQTAIRVYRHALTLTSIFT